MTGRAKLAHGVIKAKVSDVFMELGFRLIYGSSY